MARFRQRFSVDQLNAINETICEQDKKDDDEPPTATSGEPKHPAKTTENKGKLIMDATCVPADIRFVFFQRAFLGLSWHYFCQGQTGFCPLSLSLLEMTGCAGSPK